MLALHTTSRALRTQILAVTASLVSVKNVPTRVSKNKTQWNGRRSFSSNPKKYTMVEADPSMYLADKSSSKLVHFVRHAEGIHNAAARDNPDEFWEKLFNSAKLWDSPLNKAGMKQCETLEARISEAGIDVDVVLVSPLTRTLQTAALSFGKACPRARMVAMEDCRERIAVYTSEGRADTAELKADWPQVDFSLIVAESDPMFDTKEDDEAVGRRALGFVEKLMLRPEPRIAVVSHSVFLQQLYKQFEHSLPRAFHDERQDFATLRTVAICPRDQPK